MAPTYPTRVFLDDVRHRKRRVQAYSLDAGTPESLEGEGGMQYDAADKLDLEQQSTNVANIDRALSHLSDEQRELLLAHHNGLDYSELAADLDLPLGTIRSRLHRARAIATYYGVLEGVVEFDQLTDSLKTKVTSKLMALGREFSRNGKPQAGAEFTAMLYKIRGAEAVRLDSDWASELARRYEASREDAAA